MDQLDKLLALADSSHDAEAVVAVRKAREMLARSGLTFADLARVAQKPRTGVFSIFSGGQQAELEAQLALLRQQIDTIQTEMQSQTFQIDFWRRRSNELEQSFHAARAEAERWRKLTRETVEKLWDLGQDIQLGVDASDDVPAADEPEKKTA